MNYQQEIQQRVYYRLIEDTEYDLEVMDSQIKFQLECLKEEEERNGKETYDYGFMKGELGQFYKMKDYYQCLLYSLGSPNLMIKEEVE